MEANREADFIKACDQHSDALFRYCYFKVSDREVAKDLVQETYMKTWNFLLKGQEIGNIKAFFYKVLGNLIVDEYRKKKTVSLDKLSEVGFDPGFDELENLENKIDAEKALEIIRQIPDTYSEPIFMRYVEDMSIKEIAEITGDSENMVAVKVHRGFKKVRKLLNDK